MSHCGQKANDILESIRKSMASKLRVDVKRMWPGFFSVVPSNRTRDHGHKLEHQKFHVNVGITFFTLRITEHWNELLREVGESSLEILKTRMVAVVEYRLFLQMKYHK